MPRADFAKRAGSASSADSAKSATQAASATTATRATTATTATTAATATSAGNASALGGSPPAAFIVSCPASTTLYGGVCWDNSSRTAAGWIAASNTCGNAGGRLPTLSELVAYVDQPGAQVSAPHWSAEVVGGSMADPTVAVSDESNRAGVLSTSSIAYRCVFYRTN